MLEGTDQAAAAISAALKSIRPVGAWYFLLTLAVGHIVWHVDHAVWLTPWSPLWLVLWCWALVTCAAVPYLHLQAWTQRRLLERSIESKLEVTHAPPAPQNPVAPVAGHAPPAPSQPNESAEVPVVSRS